MKTVSKLSEKCRKCPWVNDCDKKRKVACAVADMPEPIMASAASEMTVPIAEDVLVKHDYRDVKIGPNTTITIDLEDVKEQLMRDLYRSIGLPGFSC